MYAGFCNIAVNSGSEHYTYGLYHKVYYSATDEDEHTYFCRHP